MPFLKYKKGSAGGITAFLLFGFFIILANVIFFAMLEVGIITTESWIEKSLQSAMMIFLFMIIYYVFVRNVFNQGVKEGKSEFGE